MSKKPAGYREARVRSMDFGVRKTGFNPSSVPCLLLASGKVTLTSVVFSFFVWKVRIISLSLGIAVLGVIYIKCLTQNRTM